MVFRINSTANHAITYINCTWEFPFSTHACVITLCSQPSLNNVGMEMGVVRGLHNSQWLHVLGYSCKAQKICRELSHKPFTVRSNKRSLKSGCAGMPKFSNQIMLLQTIGRDELQCSVFEGLMKALSKITTYLFRNSLSFTKTLCTSQLLKSVYLQKLMLQGV